MLNLDLFAFVEMEPVEIEMGHSLNFGQNLSLRPPNAKKEPPTHLGRSTQPSHSLHPHFTWITSPTPISASFATHPDAKHEWRSVKDSARGFWKVRGGCARRSSMKTLLVGLGCGGVLGLLPGVAVQKPRAALA